MTANSKNPFTWIEIYVDDIPRAQKFYESVLQIKMIPMQAPGEFGELEMASFPWTEGKANISGALCKMSGWKPSPGGTLAYFASEDCAVETSRVESSGGKVIQNKMSIGEHGFISLCIDTEGNTIGLHSKN